MSVADELEFNPFYRELQTRFSVTYEEIQQCCLHICIPASSTLAGYVINKQFVDMHVLRPSPILRDHYTTIMNGKELSWRISDGAFHLQSFPGAKIPILSEEIAYNKQLKQYKIFVTHGPLDPQYKPIQEAVPKTSKPPRTMEEHRAYLQSLPRCERAFQELEEAITTFLERYVVVNKMEALMATAKKLESIARKANMSFVQLMRRESAGDRRLQESIWLSVQAYLMARVHATVFPAVCESHIDQEKFYVARCRALRNKFIPEVLGVPEDYHCSYPATIALLNNVESLSSPLEKLYCIQDAMDAVTCDVKDHFAKILHYGDPQPLPSDHLIALLATILVQCSLAHIPSTVCYLQHFYWPASDADRLCYVLVTFIAAVEYIRGSEVVSFLPSQPQAPATNSSKKTSNASGNTTLPSATSGSYTGSRPGSEPSSEQQKTVTTPVQYPPTTNDSSDLGPFLSQLLANDTVTSQDFYRRKESK